MQRVAFLTTVFPTKDKFLITFFDSLEQQTYKNFDIIVVNDGYKKLQVFQQKYKNLKIIELPYKNTPAKNREYGINYCIDAHYDILIFGDSDDYFAENRVAKSLELLKSYDIVVNDLSLFNEDGIYEEKYISHRVNNLSNINFDFIRDKNIFGLSNTAINLNNNPNIVIPDDLIAVDWYIFSTLLMEGKRAVFINETISYYRQHQQNVVGFKPLDEASFKKGLEVKKKHYEALSYQIDGFSSELKRLSVINFTDNTKSMDNPLWWESI